MTGHRTQQDKTSDQHHISAASSQVSTTGSAEDQPSPTNQNKALIPKDRSELLKVIVELTAQCSYKELGNSEEVKHFSTSEREGTCWHIREEDGWSCYEISVLNSGDTEVRKVQECPLLPENKQ
jgi:hypothetical protein